MKVWIIDEDGKTIGPIPVVLQGMNYTPSDEEYFSIAWRSAVEDGFVDPEAKSKYKFMLKK